MQIQTAAIHALHDFEHRAVVPPVHLASTFALDPETEGGEYAYQRSSNPTRTQLETVLATLEGSAHAFAFASGMAATAAALSILREGEEILLPASVYGGTYRFVGRVLPARGVTGRYVDHLDELTDEDFTPATRAVFVETPANPTLRITDLRRVVELAHRHGARVIVDNTFMTPVLQKPLDLGADVVVQSATKYLAGHSDLLAGVVTTSDDELAEAYRLCQQAEGGVLAPQDSFRLIQSLKTLPLRPGDRLPPAGARGHRDRPLPRLPQRARGPPARLPGQRPRCRAVLRARRGPGPRRLPPGAALPRLRGQPRRGRVADLPTLHDDARGDDPAGAGRGRDLR